MKSWATLGIGIHISTMVADKSIFSRKCAKMSVEQKHGINERWLS